MTAPEWPWGDWGPGVTLGSVVESGDKATELDFFLPPPGDLPAPVGAAENRGSRRADVGGVGGGPPGAHKLRGDNCPQDLFATDVAAEGGGLASR